MKKYIIITLLTFAFILNACNTKNVQDNVLNIAVVGVGESDLFINLQSEKIYDDYHYKDESQNKKMNFEFLGQEYTLSYKESIHYGLWDKDIDEYSVDGEEESAVYFNKKTGKPEKIFIFESMNNENINEERCIEIINSAFGDDVDLSQYLSKISTTYGIQTEKSYRRVTVEGFREQQNVSESSIYDFSFTKKNKYGIELPVGIKASFWEDGLNIEYYRYDDLDIDFEEIEVGLIEDMAFQYLKKHINKLYKFKGVDFGSKQFRVIENNLYVVAGVKCNFVDKNGDDFS